MDLQEIMNKEYYIVDCKNFIFYPRIVKVIGFEMTYDSPLGCIINIPHPCCSGENRKMYLDELERFKTFEEADKYAQKLNENPDNKKRAQDWNSVENQYNLYKMEGMIEHD